MLAWKVLACTWNDCPHARKYRPVGSILAESLPEALDRLYPEFEHTLQNEESLCIGPEARLPSIYERIAHQETP